MGKISMKRVLLGVIGGSVLIEVDPDKNTLTKINSVLVSEGPYTAAVMYSHQGNFMVKLYENKVNQSTLKGV